MMSFTRRSRVSAPRLRKRSTRRRFSAESRTKAQPIRCMGTLLLDSIELVDSRVLQRRRREAARITAARGFCASWPLQDRLGGVKHRGDLLNERLARDRGKRFKATPERIRRP